MQCAFIKKDKERCNAHSLKKSMYCFLHDPGSMHEALQASRDGGANRSRSISFTEELPLKTPSDIQSLIGKTINGVWQGKIPTKVGSAIGFLARCWLDAHEKADLENRIAKIEEQLNAL